MIENIQQIVAKLSDSYRALESFPCDMSVKEKQKKKKNTIKITEKFLIDVFVSEQLV